MRPDFDLATASPEERARERRRLWRLYRRLKREAVDAKGYLAAADVLGKLTALGGESRPVRQRRAR